MAYIDSSEIVLDATLTEEGRDLLAKGELEIEYFALFDDEVDYTLFDENALFGERDKKIVSLPILESSSNLRPRFFLTNIEPRIPRRKTVELPQTI